MKIAINELRDKMLKTLEQSFTTEDASRITDVLLWADMSGVKPMGLAKMTGTEPIQNIVAQHEVRIERETQISQLINAGGMCAPLVCQRATDTAISKAKEHGMAIVGVRNTHSSNLTQAFYVDRIAQNDLIGICMSSAPGSAAPFESIDPIFGTNPFGYAFPTNNEPLVFDMTTAAMTWSGLLLAKARGEALPEGIAIDHNGEPTTDPAEAVDGATLMFGGNSYKSSGLSLMVETLAGPLVGAAYCDMTSKGEWGSVFIAIDPNILVDTADFKNHASDLIEKIQNSRKRVGVTQIRLPGERARASHEEAKRSGMVDVDKTVLQLLGYI